MKKVVIFEFQDVRYASRARKEAFSLANNGYDVTLIGFNRSIKKSKSRRESNINIVEYSLFQILSGTFFQKVLNIIYMNFSIINYFRKKDFDIYHLHNLNLIIPAYYAYRIKKKKLIYDAHELHIKKRIKNTFKTKLLNKNDEFAERLLIRIASAILQASSLRAHFFANYYKTTMPLVIENHANLTAIDYEIKDIREMLGLSGSVRIIVFTGFIRVGENQRVDNIIKALQYLAEDIHFCAIGTVDEYSKKVLIGLSKKIGVEKRFHLFPPVLSENVVSTISSADIGVIPIYAQTLNSKYSALNKLSQFLMAGLAIATTNYENLREIILNNKFGLVGNVFDVNNPQDIAVTINSIFSKDLKEFKKNARILAERSMNWEHEEAKLLSLYHSLFL